MKETRNLSAVNNVLNKVLHNLGLDKRLREHTFLSLWPTFVSGPIGSRSRALFIDADRNLVITVADASTGQELSMSKGQILTKVKAAGKSLNIEINGLRLDLKHYHGTSTSVQIGDDGRQKLPRPAPGALEAIVLTSNDIEQLQRLKVEMDKDSISEEMQTKIIAGFEAELRLRKWRMANGYPICEACGNPVDRLHTKSAAHVPKADEVMKSKPKVRERASLCIACLYTAEP